MDNHLKYRADIDGLRAIAVLGVVFFHAGLGVPGGFVGVDVFFVISGYLITSLILKDLRNGKFSMIEFWERRIRRIFPALAVLVVSCLVVGWFLLLPFGYLVLAQSSIALSFFASNIQFWRTANYFGPEAEENLLLHTWSLSVEEQFYILVPLMLAGLFAWKRERLLPWVIGLGAIGSLLLSILWLERNPKDAFYLLPSRAWELAAGSFLVFLPTSKSHSLRLFASLLGIVALAFPFIFYDKHVAFPGIAALPPVIGTALLIWSGSGGTTFIHRALSWKPLVAIGLISYSLYLWHWPFFALHRYIFGTQASLSLALGYVFVAFVLSILSLFFIERPFREKRVFGTRAQIFGFFIVGSTLIAAFSFFVYFSGGVPQRLPTEVALLDRVDGNEKFSGFAESTMPGGVELSKIGNPAGQKSVLVWGDSHAGVALGAIDKVCRELDLNGIAITRGGTPPVFGWSGWPETTWEHINILKSGDFVRGYLSEDSELHPKYAVLVFRWSHYVPRREQLPQMDNIPLSGFGNALVKTIELLQEKGVHVAVMLEPPVFQSHVPRSAAMNAWRGFPMPKLTILEYQAFNEDYAPILKQLRSKVPEAILMDPAPYLAPDGDNVEFLDEDGVLLYRDQHHLTSRGAERLKPLFRDFLQNSAKSFPRETSDKASPK